MDDVLFPTHLAVAVLLGLQSRLSPGWIVVGAVIPDLVDKPLAMLGMMELYHTVGHSGLIAVVLVPAALLHRSALALTVGWLSHLALDVFHVFINGRPADALFVAWPVAVPPDPFAVPPVPFLVQYLWTPSFWVEIGIWALLGLAVAYSRWPKGWRRSSFSAPDTE